MGFLFQSAFRAKIRQLEATDFSEQDRPVTEDHELHAAGQRCVYCGNLIAASEPARLVGDGDWVHDSCHKPRH
jgi:hypothetical protein